MKRTPLPAHEIPRAGALLWFNLSGRETPCLVVSIDADRMTLDYGGVTFGASVSEFVERRRAEYAAGDQYGDTCSVCGDDIDDCGCL